MKHVTIYERKNVFYIRASSKTNVGVWIEDGECYAVNVDSNYEEIGECVCMALDKSRTNIPHPTDWKDIGAPLFKAARVHNWSTFGKIAKCIHIYKDENFCIIPTINKSKVKEGFVEKASHIISIPMNTGLAELGRNIKEAWLLCE